MIEAMRQHFLWYSAVGPLKERSHSLRYSTHVIGSIVGCLVYRVNTPGMSGIGTL